MGPTTYISCLSVHQTDRQLIPLLGPLRWTNEQLIQVIWGLGGRSVRIHEGLGAGAKRCKKGLGSGRELGV